MIRTFRSKQNSLMPACGISVMKCHGGGKRTLNEEIDGIKDLLKFVAVDIESGRCYWNVHRGRVVCGSEAGTKNADGYTAIRLDGCYYKRHR
ncbi:putative homing endonuclease [Klebsiella phage CPRSB]|nr:putative homing endonuclease [Klebsiella phage CPRSB]